MGGLTHFPKEEIIEIHMGPCYIYSIKKKGSQFVLIFETGAASTICKPFRTESAAKEEVEALIKNTERQVDKSVLSFL